MIVTVHVRIVERRADVGSRSAVIERVRYTVNYEFLRCVLQSSITLLDSATHFMRLCTLEYCSGL